MNKSAGFSLLEILLVLALMALLMGLAVPYWQAQEYPVRRQLAWLQLQQLLLAQAEYHMQTGAYAADLAALLPGTLVPGYELRMQQAEDGLWLQAVVQVEGRQAGDQACWQLWLHESGLRQAYDRQGHQTFACE